MVYPPLPSLSLVGEDSKVKTRALKSRLRLYSDLKLNNYVVFINALPGEILKTVSLTKSIHEKFEPPNEVKIFYVSKTKIKVVCPSAEVANNLINNNELQINYNVQVPFRSLEVKGRVPISSEFTEKEIFDNIKIYNESKDDISPKILEVYRILYTDKSDPENHKITNSNNVIITFEGKTIPKFISIYNLIIPVFVQADSVRQCKKCWRFGHSTNVCRGKDTCCKCGKPHHDDTCDLKCVNCGNSHSANDKLCPIFLDKKNFNFKKAKFTSQPEKKDIQNPFHYEPEEFPPLLSPKEKLKINTSNTNVQPDINNDIQEVIEMTTPSTSPSEEDNNKFRNNRKRPADGSLMQDKRVSSMCNSTQIIQHVQNAFYDVNWMSQLVTYIQSYHKQDAIHILKDALDQKFSHYVSAGYLGSQDPNSS